MREEIIEIAYNNFRINLTTDEASDIEQLFLSDTSLNEIEEDKQEYENIQSEIDYHSSNLEDLEREQMKLSFSPEEYEKGRIDLIRKLIEENAK